MSRNLMQHFSCVYDEKKRLWISGSRESPFSENNSIGQILFERLKQRTNKVLQIDHTYGISITNEQALSWSIRVALYLKELNLNHHDIVGISARNSTYLLPAVLGCFFSGVPFHAVNPDLDEDTLAQYYGMTHPKVIFCDGEDYEKISASTRNDRPLLVTISEHIEGVTKILDLLEPKSGEDYYEPSKLVDGPSQTIAILCSSGTTGKPKAVCLSTRSFTCINPVMTSDALVFIGSGIDWYTGLYFLIHNCLMGFARIITKRLFDIDYFLQLIKKYKITYSFLSSRYVAALVNHPEATKENLKSLKAIQFGGSKLSEATLKRFTDLFKENVIFGFAYGTTEIGVVTLNMDTTHIKSVGKLMPNLKLRIVSEEGENLAINEIGEVLVFSSVGWRGYYNNPSETAKVLDSEGWFHTGDLGYMDENNFLYVVERKKEILKYQGHHYWPNEIEHVVLELPDVTDVCVVAVYDEQRGDVAGALIVKAANSSLTAEQVIQHVKQRLILSHKQINAGVYFVDQLPYNSNNKCLRNKAKTMLENFLKK